MKLPLEKDIQKAILKFLRLHGAFAVRVNSGMAVREYKGKRHVMRGNDTPGCPDILFALRGRFGGCEVKRPGGKPTEAQASALDAVRRAGGVGFVADSIEAVERALRAEGLI